MKHTYLSKLYNYHKGLFMGVILFCLITATLTLKGYELTPLFVWGMYSQKQDPPARVDAPYIVLNDSVIFNTTRGNSPSTMFLINSPVSYYIAIKENSGADPVIDFYHQKVKRRFPFIAINERFLSNDSTRINRFLPWLARYCSIVSGYEVHAIKIINEKLKLNPDGIIVRDTIYNAGSWHR